MVRLPHSNSLYIYISMSSILDRLSEGIDPDSALPIYHQLAAIIRFEVASGRLPIGTVLPPVRAVARAVGINYHTVRRGWEELATDGLISLRRGRGGVVLRAPAPRSEWSPAPSGPADAAAARVWVVASTLEAAATLAHGVGRRWEVEAVPWPLVATAPPPGVILAAGALLAAPRARWSHRAADYRELPLVVAPQFLPLIRRNATLLGSRRVVLVGPANDPELRALSQQLPRIGLPITWQQGCRLDEAIPATLHVVHPEAWLALDPADRVHPASLQLLVEFAPGPLSGLAREQGWHPASA